MARQYGAHAMRVRCSCVRGNPIWSFPCNGCIRTIPASSSGRMTPCCASSRSWTDTISPGRCVTMRRPHGWGVHPRRWVNSPQSRISLGEWCASGCRSPSDCSMYRWVVPPSKHGWTPLHSMIVLKRWRSWIPIWVMAWPRRGAKRVCPRSLDGWRSCKRGGFLPTSCIGAMSTCRHVLRIAGCRDSRECSNCGGQWCCRPIARVLKARCGWGHGLTSMRPTSMEST